MLPTRITHQKYKGNLRKTKEIGPSDIFQIGDTYYQEFTRGAVDVNCWRALWKSEPANIHSFTVAVIPMRDTQDDTYLANFGAL